MKACVRQRSNDEGLFLVTEEHWKNLKSVCDLLGPLRDATEVLSGQQYPTLSMVVPFYNALLTNLESKCNQNGSSAFLADAANAAYCKLYKYYDISSELCTIATVLDPRLKLKFYKDGYTG